jgi:hypothetical protein
MKGDNMGEGLKRARDAALVSGVKPGTVQVGQIWEECDPRMVGRRIRVVEVGKTHATVVNSTTGTARKTRIRLDRFKPSSTGYKMVSESQDR